MRTAASIILSLLIFAGIDAQEVRDISTSIEKAILFPDRAQLFHTGEAAINPGTTILKIKGLSPRIISETIQVQGGGDFMIMSVNQQVNYLDNQEESEEVTGLRAKIELLSAKIEDELTAIEVLKEKEAFLVANRVISGGEQGITSTELKILTDQYVAGIESVRSGILKKTRISKQYRDEKTKLEKQLSEAVNRSSLPVSELVVTVSSTKSLSAKIMINYLVMDAGWFPSYDIRVEGTDSPAAIFYKANVWQNSGIEWKNIKLSFSSASPSVSGVLPILYPWYINFYQENNMMIRGVSSKSAPAARQVTIEESDYIMDEEVSAYSPPVTISESATNFSFDLDIKQNISSGRRPSVIELQRLSTEAIYKYIAIPKLKEEAFLTAGIRGWESLNLLDGEANIYFGNTFTGKSYINRSQLSDTLNISLGQDANITVKREKRKEFEATRMIGANRVDTRSYLITVRNTRKSSIDISLFDQVPLSQNSQIEVEAEEITGGVIEKATGKVRWDFTLGPNQSKELIITYTVKYPKNQKVIINN